MPSNGKAPRLRLAGIPEKGIGACRRRRWQLHPPEVPSPLITGRSCRSVYRLRHFTNVAAGRPQSPPNHADQNRALRFSFAGGRRQWTNGRWWSCLVIRRPAPPPDNYPDNATSVTGFCSGSPGPMPFRSAFYMAEGAGHLQNQLPQYQKKVPWHAFRTA